MKLTEQVTDDVTVLEPFGRLDSTTAKELVDRLISLVQVGRSAIVVDLKNIILHHQRRVSRAPYCQSGHSGKARQARAVWSDRQCQASIRNRLFH
jgi:hypothetical protein